MNKTIYLLFILAFSSCVTMKADYKTFAERLGSGNSDSREFLASQIKAASAKGLIGTEPMVVIDGIVVTEENETEQMNILYKEDIDKVHVLGADKGVGIYGEDASDGIVLVTRKEEASKFLKHYLKKSR